MVGTQSVITIDTECVCAWRCAVCQARTLGAGSSILELCVCVVVSCDCGVCLLSECVLCSVCAASMDVLCAWYMCHGLMWVCPVNTMYGACVLCDAVWVMWLLCEYCVLL